MSIEEHINEIREGLRKGLFSNEAAVSNSIVSTLLGALGWPRHNPGVFMPEYSVEGGRVDFALCHPAEVPRIFIEVKRVGNIEGADKQLLQYAFYKGVPIALLTDGQRWVFYHPLGQGDFNERKVYEMDLVQDKSETCAEYLCRYLNYESMRAGEAIQTIKDDYENVVQQRHAATRLPEAWQRLIEEADEFLVDVVAEEAESLCGYKPTDEQTLDFLKSLERKPVGCILDPPPDIQPSRPLSRRSSGERALPTRLVVTMSNGEKIEHETAVGTFLAVLEKFGFERVRALEYQFRKRNLISTTPYDRIQQHQSGRYYIMTHARTTRKKRILEEIAEQLGVDLKVEIVDK